MKRLLNLLILCFVSTCLISCANDENEQDSDSPIDDEVETEMEEIKFEINNPVPGASVTIFENTRDLGYNQSREKLNFEEVIYTTVDDDYVCEGTPTLAPYTVYNEDGTVHETHTYMTYALRSAGEVASSSNKAYVLDANGLKIYERASKSNYYCYDGTNYVGVKSRSEAIKWSEGRSKSYLIDGFATAYQTCGTAYYPGSETKSNPYLELNAGAYNYMFTKMGDFKNNTFVENGYGYMECTVNLKDATYKPTEDPGRWNAFIFLHGRCSEYADMGLRGIINDDNEMVWELFRGCSHKSHTEDPDTYGIKWSMVDCEPVTKMTYNEEKGYYEGQDDLFMQLWMTVDGWVLRVTNLTNNKVYQLVEYHKDMMAGQEGYFQLLLATSYCPAVANIWNNRCGAFLRNVSYTNVKIARYNSNNTYTVDMLEDFEMNKNMSYGFS